MRVHVLTPGFSSPNGRAFLFPLVVWRRELTEAGITVQFFGRDLPALADCDVLIVDSKYFSARWSADGGRVEAEIAALAARVGKLFWFDITDSSGWDHARALPHVTAWFKNQLLCDRKLYCRPLYGAGRFFCDIFYSQKLAEDEVPLWSAPVPDVSLLEKLHVGWNSALADYSLWGPSLMALYGRVPCDRLLRFPRSWPSPRSPRSLPVACRFGVSYDRETVAWQRREIARLMAGRLPTGKLNRRAYLAELVDARVVVSPFGLGEITLKDFEVFMTGATLLKPAMDHLETWPDLYKSGETFVAHAWDLSDFVDVVESLLADDDRRMRIGEAGQAAYLRHTVGPNAAELFIGHFRSILAVGTS